MVAARNGYEWRPALVRRTKDRLAPRMLVPSEHHDAGVRQAWDLTHTSPSPEYMLSERRMRNAHSFSNDLVGAQEGRASKRLELDGDALPVAGERVRLAVDALESMMSSSIAHCLRFVATALQEVWSRGLGSDCCSLSTILASLRSMWALCPWRSSLARRASPRWMTRCSARAPRGMRCGHMHLVTARWTRETLNYRLRAR